MADLTRVNVPKLDEVLGKEHPILDKGFVRVVDYMGNDSSIVQAARVSYGQGTKTMRQDAGLISYLIRNDHTTPFEMCEIKLHIKLPIFVARQWIRHRTANVNEYSARYSLVEDDFYVPELDQVAMQSPDNKQGRGESLSPEAALAMRDLLSHLSRDCHNKYTEMLNSNVARELSRLCLPVNFYTEWYWKIDLHNLMRFLILRSHRHAQYEIRQYALVILDIMRMWVPMTYEAFIKNKLKSRVFNAAEMNVLRSIFRGEKVGVTESNLSDREFKELMSDLELNSELI